jgi:hypothetical protein
MPTCTTTIPTAHARKYLQQLCKHFAHKVTVDFTPEEGRVLFPPGRCLMNADDRALTFHCISREERGIPVIQGILDRHLVKFAWREELDYQWSGATPAALVAMLEADDFLPEASAEGAGVSGA